MGWRRAWRLCGAAATPCLDFCSALRCSVPMWGCRLRWLMRRRGKGRTRACHRSAHHASRTQSTKACRRSKASWCRRWPWRPSPRWPSTERRRPSGPRSSRCGVPAVALANRQVAGPQADRACCRITRNRSRLQDQRPPPAERRFNSSVIEAVISDITSRMTDPALATIFGNAFPNTLGPPRAHPQAHPQTRHLGRGARLTQRCMHLAVAVAASRHDDQHLWRGRRRLS